MRKICVVSATRAEWYLLANLCREIRADKNLKLQLVLTGAHLSDKFGKTCEEIEAEFEVAKKVQILGERDDKNALCKALSKAVGGFGEVFAELKPDILVLLGDRYEMLGIAAAATMWHIPIAHLCGGELSLGAMDDSIRHALTKLSHLHFVATKIYAKRVMQLGENKKRVFNVGSLNGEVIANLELLSKKELEKALNFSFKERIFLITYHPETLNLSRTKSEVEILLKNLDNLENSSLIFTKANADENGLLINEMIAKYAKNHAFKARLFDNLGSKLYLSAMKHAAAVVGNSSSGICESGFFRTPCINIGDRQSGRIRAKNIIDTKMSDLKKAFKRLESVEFRADLRKFKNPFRAKNASKIIKNTLKSVNLNEILHKKFMDRKWK